MGKLGVARIYFATVGLAFALAGPTSAQQAQVVISGPGGIYQDAQRKVMYEPATKDLGIAIKEDTGGELSTVRAQVRSGRVIYDLVSLGAQDCVVGSKENLFEPIDYSVVDKSGFPAEYAQRDWIGIIYYSTVITYNRTKYGSNPPKTWADFWDGTKFKGEKSLRNIPQLMIEAALLADGVPADKLYPLDLDRAFKSLDKVKPQIATWWTTGAQTAQLIKSGEVDMIGMWNGRADPVIKDGADFAFTYNQGLVTADCYAVPRGAKNKDAAMKVLAYMVRPQVLAGIPKYIPYGPVNEKALDFVPADVRKILNSSPENLKIQVRSNEEWWYENGAKARERWDAFLAR